jgi:mercuric ion binding protein
MRRLLLAALLATPLGVLAADPQTVVLDVQNMTCELCPITVKKALDKVPGVAATRIDLGKKTATVQFDPDRANVVTLVKATTNASYPSTVQLR